ncbi:MAG: RHS repeat domain-containing protein [Saprospiraceae bacterium]
MKTLIIMIVQHKTSKQRLVSRLSTCWLVLLFLLSSILVCSAHEQTYNTSLDQSGHVTGASIFVKDPLRTDPIGIAPNVNYVVERAVEVSLVYHRAKRTDIIGNYWWYRIHYEVYEEGATTPYESGSIEINHQQAGGVYEALNKYLTNTGAVQLKIVQIEASTDAWQTTISNPVDIVPEDIRLELRMNVERYDYLAPTATTNELTDIFSVNTHSLQVYWRVVSGAEYYELEWVHIDSEVTTPPTPAQRFDNAIRVEVCETNYKISTLYPAGELYYRVRPVGRFIRGQSEYTHLKYGAWSSGTNVRTLPGFETDKNWQSVSSFAEEGKSKHVVNFFDKGLRSRQSQVNLSTEEQVLVSTNHYDVEGRGTLNTLPVPAKNNENNLFYKPKFNQNLAGNAYDRDDFDKSGYAEPVNTTSGAGYYFSSAHAADVGANDLYKDYIPDAGGFPLTQTIFSNDGLGRVIEQGGVGAFYQIGKGSTTKYYYDDPSETQLRRLFGKNVGAAKYYKRNIVEDPNGQLSVSYLDISGRVIATALAGASPSNVDSLESRTTKYLTESLIDNNVVNTSQGTSTVTTKVMNEEVDNIATFNYDFKGKNESFLLPAGELCLSCRYELTISMTSPCGLPVTMNFPTGADTVYQQQFTGADISCPLSNTTFDVPAVSFSVTMNEVGTYYLKKQLKVVEKDIEDWVQVLEGNDLLPPIEYFDSLYIAQIDTAACEFDCYHIYYETCYEAGATQGLTGDDLNDFIEVCVDEQCSASVTTVLASVAERQCEVLYNQLILQVSPDGCLYGRGKWWEDYNIDLGDLQFDVLQEAGNYLTYAGDDLEMQDYLQNASVWQSEWAELIVVKHPEYCDYEFCQSSYESRLFDLELSSTTSYTDAVAKGLAVENAPGSDPDYAEAIRLSDPAFINTGVLQNSIYNCDDLGSTLALYSNDPLDCDGDGVPDASTNSFRNLHEFVECAFSGESEAVKWQRLLGFYKGVKEQALRECADNYCPGTGDNCSLKQSVDIFEVDTEEEAEALAGNKVAELCISFCEENVEFWLAEITANCTGLDAGDLFSIRKKLENYCEGSCGYENPLAHLLTEELQDENLIAIQNILDDSDCTDSLLLNMSVTISESYTVALNENGDTIFHEVLGGCYIAPCIQDALAAGDDLVRYNECYVGGTSGINYPDVDAYDWVAATNTTCTDSVGGQFKSLVIKSIDLELGFIYLSSSFTDYVGVCDLERIMNPQIYYTVTGSYIGVDGILKSSGDTVLLEVTRIGGIYGPLIPCIDTMTVPVLIPRIDTVVVNLDTLRQHCIEELYAEALILAEEAWQDSVDVILSTVINAQECLEPLEEHFSVRNLTTEHHYTLYYYDQAGNLVQTVPPLGVVPLENEAMTVFNDQGEWIGGSTVPNHKLLTEYRYNTIGQVYWQNSPDANESRFYYDDAQRLRVSQNARQKANALGAFSYTKYDVQNRIVEVGQIENYTLEEEDLNIPTFPTMQQNYNLTQQTKTYYDDSYLDPNFTQSHLRNRVSYTENENIRTLYDYDVHGNVNSLQHEIFDFTMGIAGTTFPGIDKHQINYRYDLISGNVLSVAFQAGKRDEFYHRYEYDADNRLTFVKTSEDGNIWETDARYFYYAHGPLARVELGQDKVQGQDYYYNLQGWIKGVNQGGVQSHLFEMGLDGHAATVTNKNALIARDEYAYLLGYHDQDYQAINAGVNLGSGMATVWEDLSSNILSKELNGETHYGLFNGNIALMFTDIKGLNGEVTGNEGMQTMTYQYDQLHRIKQAHSNHYVAGAASWSPNGKYDASYRYDPDGNLLNLKRAGPQGLMDDLNYHYKEHNHQLLRVDDDVTNDNLYTNDLDHREDITGDFYTYDKIGNLIADQSEEIETIKWSVYGKPLEVIFTAGSNKENIRYSYDASGNRLSKTKVSPLPGRSTTTFYVRDASGNIMSVYERIYRGSTILFQKETPIFGSSRLGVRNYVEKHLSYEGNVIIASVIERDRGLVVYELSNHLGNVLATVSDYKRGIDWDAGVQDGKLDYYLANVRSASDYYPFGLAMVGRQSNVGGYRYGFNGKEIDQDMNQSGQGQSVYDYGFRIYNPSIAKFLSVDPLTKSYPELTPYQFASDSPIANIDLDGLERYWAVDGSILGKYGESTELMIVTDVNMIDRARKALANNKLENSTFFEKELPSSSTKAYEETDKNELSLLRNWAKRNRNDKQEFAMSLFSKFIQNDKEKGYFPVIIKGTLAEGKRARVNPSDSKGPEGWHRSTTIHTHPNNNTFSNEAPGFLSGGDIQWSVSNNIKLYLVPSEGENMEVFDPKLYIEFVLRKMDRSNEKYKEDLMKMYDGLYKLDHPNKSDWKKGDLGKGYWSEPHRNEDEVKEMSKDVKIDP